MVIGVDDFEVHEQLEMAHDVVLIAIFAATVIWILVLQIARSM